MRHGYLTVGADDALFVSLNVPDRAITRVVVFCPDILFGQTIDRRRERMWAQALSEHGVASVRFDYARTGNSSGTTQCPRWADLVRDASAAAELSFDATGCRDVTFVGTRFSCFVAAEVARWYEPHAAMLFAPHGSGDAYWRDAFKIAASERLARGCASLPTTGDAERLAGGAAIDLLGYEVSPGLYADTRDLYLPSLVAGLSARVVLFARGAIPDKSVDELRQRRATACGVAPSHVHIVRVADKTYGFADPRFVCEEQSVGPSEVTTLLKTFVGAHR